MLRNASAASACLTWHQCGISCLKLHRLASQPVQSGQQVLQQSRRQAAGVNIGFHLDTRLLPGTTHMSCYALNPKM